MHQQDPTPFISPVWIYKYNKAVWQTFLCKKFVRPVGVNLHPKFSEKFLKKSEKRYVKRFVNLTFCNLFVLEEYGFPKHGKCLVKYRPTSHTLLADILFAQKVCQINCLEIKKKALKTPRFQCFLELLLLRLNQWHHNEKPGAPPFELKKFVRIRPESQPYFHPIKDAIF